MTKIYLTRHGETEWNVQRRMQGRLDSPLTERGKHQAVLLGNRLADTAIDVIYSSTSPRAVTTAGLIRAGRNIPQLQHAGFCEMGLGPWEGKEVQVLMETENGSCQNFFYHPELFVPPAGAENFEELQQRFVAALREVAAKHEGQTILVVAHGMVLRNMLAYFTNQRLQDIWTNLYKPTALSLLNMDEGKFELVFWNDTAHYEAEA